MLLGIGRYSLKKRSQSLSNSWPSRWAPAGAELKIIVSITATIVRMGSLSRRAGLLSIGSAPAGGHAGFTILAAAPRANRARNFRRGRTLNVMLPTHHADSI